MKKNILIVIALMLVIFPFTVRADKVPVAFGGYAVEGTIGSEIVFEIKGLDGFDGTITYNKDELSFLSTDVIDPTIIEGPRGPIGEIKIISNNPGELKFTFKLGEDSSNEELKFLQFKFKVKSVLSENKVTITYSPDDASVLYGSKTYSAQYDIITASSQDSSELKDRVNETFDKANKIIDEGIAEVSLSNTIMKIVPWTLSGVLFVALIVVILKKKNNL